MVSRQNDLSLNICRLCMQAGPPMIKIFGHYGLSRKLAVKMREVFPFTIEENDNLPKFLCHYCINKLENHHNYILKGVIINNTLTKHCKVPDQLFDSFVVEDDLTVPSRTLNSNLHKQWMLRNNAQVGIFNSMPGVSGNGQWKIEEVPDISVANQCQGLKQNVNSVDSKGSIVATLQQTSGVPCLPGVADGNANAGKNVGMFNCRKCGKEFKTRDEHLLHYCNAPYINSMKCRYCGREFISEAGLRLHTKKHTNIKQFACRYCRQGFQSWQACNIHMNTECKLGSQKPAPFSCVHCKRSFLSLAAKKAHLTSKEHKRRSSKDGLNKTSDTAKMPRDAKTDMLSPAQNSKDPHSVTLIKHKPIQEGNVRNLTNDLACGEAQLNNMVKKKSLPKNSLLPLVERQEAPAPASTADTSLKVKKSTPNKKRKYSSLPTNTNCHVEKRI